MADKSKIEWTDATWNPVTGCSKVSAGCKNCYAEREFPRVYGTREFNDVRCHSERIEIPLRWRRPRRVFVNSMSDLFHPSVPDEFIARVFATMTAAKQHTFQVLTKRPERMRDFINGITQWEGWWVYGDKPVAYGGTGLIVSHHAWPAPNIWLGVSVEDQATANERIPLLLETLATIRFVSAEPLLGPVEMSQCIGEVRYGELSGYHKAYDECADDICRAVPGLDWIIVGGESGPKARPMHLDWVRSIRDQCAVAGVPFTFKQWGEWAPRLYGGDGTDEHQWAEHGFQWQWMCKVGKKRAGRLLDGQLHDAYPQEVSA